MIFFFNAILSSDRVLLSFLFLRDLSGDLMSRFLMYYKDLNVS